MRCCRAHLPKTARTLRCVGQRGRRTAPRVAGHAPRARARRRPAACGVRALSAAADPGSCAHAALLAARCSGQRGRHPRAVCAGGACPEFGGDCVSVSAPARAHAYECTWQVVLAAAAPGCAVRLRARGRACNTRRWRCGVWRGTAAAVTHHGTETAPPRRQQLNLRGPASPAAFCDVYAGLPNREGGRWEAAPPALRAARAAERCAQMSRWLFRHTARRRTGARTARRRARRALRARCRPRPRAAAAAARRARRCPQPRPSAFDRAADAHASNSFHLQRRLSAPVETRQEAAPRASAHGAAAA